ncbi:hypothetical protein KQX54_007185 [Cotesia glomerata]|uniref:Nuclear protein MDM1 n=1 Tax=Cotesia glomerata TaxID=32391 RepID=A0AAV7IJN6_COTGL|nr:hypothetical protein KQX54_007185 [Cotesia glomerata]
MPSLYVPPSSCSSTWIPRPHLSLLPGKLGLQGISVCAGQPPRRRPSLRGAQKSSSDSEVALLKFRDRKTRARDLLPWPKALETLTVDELARYRRKRVPDSPKDTLGARNYEDNDHEFENLSTEYRRAFKATSEESLLRADDEKIFAHNFASNYSIQSINNPKVNINDKSMEAIEISQVPDVAKRSPIRRGTSLKHGGAFYTDTESANYKIYEGIHRAKLARRPTSLKMEGDMRTVTEQCEKFIEWLNVSRPELARIPTNLKLEGQFETSTENHDQYVPFVGARRPEILRQRAHLKLEGESNFIPEYTAVFKPHITREKRSLKVPESHLKSGGEFTGRTEHYQNFLDPRGAVPMDQSQEHVIHQIEDSKLQLERQEQEWKKEEDMNILVSKLEDLKGPPLGIPEYKDAYKDFPRERPKLLKPEDEIGRADGSKVNSSNPGKFSTKIDQDPEYKSMYLDRGQPIYRKPPLSRRPSVASSGFNRRLVPDLRQYHPTSEVRSQYVPYGNVPRTETLRRPVNLRPEGDMNLHPEYRDAYCTKRDYSVTDVKNQYRDRSLTDFRRHQNNWLTNNDNNNNDDQRGIEYSECDQNAFQVLHSRTQDDTVVNKPPVRGRRGSKGSMQVSRPTKLDLTNPATDNRSPSPSYRLHVCNVDDEPRGFLPQRPSLQHNSSSPIQASGIDDTRSYSPSFGKELKHSNDNNNQAFVVLDNASTSAVKVPESSKKRFDRNYNYESSESRRSRNKTPSNWMPPWYDNTNTT